MRQYRDVAAVSADAAVAQQAAIAPAGAAPTGAAPATGEWMEAAVALNEQAAAEMDPETECEAVAAVSADTTGRNNTSRSDTNKRRDGGSSSSGTNMRRDEGSNSSQRAGSS